MQGAGVKFEIDVVGALHRGAGARIEWIGDRDEHTDVFDQDLVLGDARAPGVGKIDGGLRQCRTCQCDSQSGCDGFAYTSECFHVVSPWVNVDAYLQPKPYCSRYGL